MKTAIAAALMLASVPAFAATGGSAGSNHLDVYYSHLDYELSDGTDSIEGDGSGGGIAFWMGNRIGLFTAEIQKNNIEGNILGFPTDADLRSLRAGMGYRLINEANRGAWIRAEYINLDTRIDVEDVGSASGETDGYGIHFGGLYGVGVVQGYGEIGFVDLDDEDGFEYRAGLAIQPGMVGGFVEYRKTALEVDDIDLDEDLEDVRIGVRVAF